MSNHKAHFRGDIQVDGSIVGPDGQPIGGGPDLRLEDDGGIMHVITGLGAGINAGDSAAQVYEWAGRVWFSCQITLADDATDQQLADLWQGNTPLFYLPNFKSRFGGFAVAPLLVGSNLGALSFYGSENGYYCINGYGETPSIFARGAQLFIECSFAAALPA